MHSSPVSAAPRWATPRTPDRPSYGRDIGRVAEAVGFPPMPHQRLIADVASELVPADTPSGWAWAYGVVIITLQRQGGKSTLLGPVAHHRALIVPDGLTWITAQTGYDARDLWIEQAKHLERSPLAQLARFRRANGTESISWRNGSTYRPFPPVEEAMHGKANQLVFVDEAWAFDDDAGTALEAAISPTFTTTGGQLWIVSAGGTARSSWLLRHVLAGRAAVTAGVNTGIAYFEYGIPAELAPMIAAGVGPDVEDEAQAAAVEAILAHHPAAGYTLRHDALVTAARTMKPNEFLRAYGNFWTPGGERVVPEALWNAGRRDPRSLLAWPVPATPAAIGFAASPDHRDGAIVAAWRDGPGLPWRLDVIDARPGTGWLPERVREVVERNRPPAVGYDKAGPALDVAAELALDDLDAPLIPTSTQEYAAACAGLLRAIVNGSLTHPGQADLDNAVSVAARRVIGDGIWAWGRLKSGASIAALEAATVAMWAFDHRPAEAAAPAVVVRTGASSRRVAPPRRHAITGRGPFGQGNLGRPA